MLVCDQLTCSIALKSNFAFRPVAEGIIQITQSNKKLKPCVRLLSIQQISGTWPWVQNVNLYQCIYQILENPWVQCTHTKQAGPIRPLDPWLLPHNYCRVVVRVLTRRGPELGKYNGSSPFSVFFHQSTIFSATTPFRTQAWYTFALTIALY